MICTNILQFSLKAQTFPRLQTNNCIKPQRGAALQDWVKKAVRWWPRKMAAIYDLNTNMQ